MAADDMNHLGHLPEIARADVSVLEAKEQTYQGSWKKAGGRSAWFMFRRNMDRLLSMCKNVEFSLDGTEALVGGKGGCTFSAEQYAQLKKALVSEDIFALIRAEPSGADGTVLACLRDLRRYALLLESEMVAEGSVAVEWGPKGKPLSGSADIGGAQIGDLSVENMDFSVVEARIMSWVGSDPSVEPKDNNRYRALVAAASLYTLGDKELDRLTAEVTELLKVEGDTYEAIGKTLRLPRNEVKRRCFHVMYSTGRNRPGRLTLADFPTPEESAEVAQQYNEAILQGFPPSNRKWEKAAIRQTLAYITGSPVEEDDVQAVLEYRQGGDVVDRVAYRINGADNALDHLCGRAYAGPTEAVSPSPPIEQHKQLLAAVEHTLNFHGVDAALGCADHILAELLVPQLLKHLRGQTGGQLLEQGWTFGPHGVPVPPPGDAKDPTTPGTPADGGHHSGEAQRLVPRPDPARGQPVANGGAAEILTLVRDQLGFHDQMGTLRVADNGARVSPGPNRELQIVRLWGMDGEFGVRYPLGPWRILSTATLNDLAALWFPGSWVITRLNDVSLSEAAAREVKAGTSLSKS